MIHSPTAYYSGDQIVENETDGACRGEKKNTCWVWW
jgi:hypothetical protein